MGRKKRGHSRNNSKSRRKPGNPPLKKQPVFLIILLAILLAGGVLRFLYLREIMQKPDFTQPSVDAGFHDFWARGLATGEWETPLSQPDPNIPEHPYLRPPGYPYFLAMIYKIFGTGYVAPRIVQMLMGMVNVVLAFLIGKKFAGKTFGIIWAAMMSVYWILIYFEGELHAPVLLIFLLLCGMYFIALWRRNPKPVFGFLSGVFIGLASLVRPNVLLFIIAAAVWAFVIFRRKNNLRAYWKGIAFFAVGAFLMIIPVTVRNYAASGELVLISANAGINLYMGNNPRAQGLCIDEIPGVGKFETCYDYPALISSLESEAGKDLSYSEVSSIFAGKALQYIIKNPGRFVVLSFRKMLYFLHPKAISHNKEIIPERQYSNVLRFTPLRFPVVFALFILGTLLLFFRKKIFPETEEQSEETMHLVSLSLVLFLTYMASVIPFFISARYRAPVIPIMMVPASFAVWKTGRLFYEKKFRYALALTGIFLVILVFTHISFLPYYPDVSKWRYDRAISWSRMGKFGKTVEESRLALKENPDNYKAHNELGHALVKTSHINEGMKHYRKAISLNPEYYPPYNNLGRVYMDRHELRKAQRYLKKAIDINPDYVKAYTNLGVVYAMAGNTKTAIEYFEKALEIQPDFQQARYNLRIAKQNLGQ